MWPFSKKQKQQALSQIVSSVGNVYDILAVDGDVFMVRDSETKTRVGFIGRATYEGVTVNGPMTPMKYMALPLARALAYNRYLSKTKSLGLHSKIR